MARNRGAFLTVLFKHRRRRLIMCKMCDEGNATYIDLPDGVVLRSSAHSNDPIIMRESALRSLIPLLQASLLRIEKSKVVQ